MALSLAACNGDPATDRLERGGFVMIIDGAKQDTVRGVAYLRDTSTNEPGVELDADSVGWSVHWMPETESSEYAIIPHVLLQEAVAAANDGQYRAHSPRDEASASMFMEYGRFGSFEAQAGTLTVEQSAMEQNADTDHVAQVQATLVDASGSDEITIHGRWHAVPAPEELPSHLQP